MSKAAFSMDRNVCLNGLSDRQTICGRKTPMPILNSVQLIATEEGVSMTGADSEICLSNMYPATVTENGGFCINAKKAYEIVKELPEGEVKFVARENGSVTISGGKAVFNLASFPVEEFPEFMFVAEETFPVDGRNLLGMLDGTGYCMSQDDTKYNMNGILLESEGMVLRAVATDGHRMAYTEDDVESEPASNFNAPGLILSAKTVTEMRKLIDADEPISVSLAENTIIFQSPAFGTMVSRLVEATFPDYRRVVPENNTNVATIDRANLVGALRRSSIMAGINATIKMDFADGKVVVTSNDEDLGDAHEEMDIDYIGNPVSIAFASKYALDAINSFTDTQVRIILGDKLAPALVMPVASNRKFAVIMPRSH